MSKNNRRFVSLVLSVAAVLLATGCDSALNSAGNAESGDEADSRAIVSDSMSTPAFIGNDINLPLVDKQFQTGQYITWSWGGCTTLMAVLNDGVNRDILLIDGYVSKATDGISDFLYTSPDQIARIYAYAQYIAAQANAGYTIRGLLTTHPHADHVGDIPLLVYFLNQLVPAQANFPIITDAHVYTNPDCAALLGLSHTVTSPTGESITLSRKFMEDWFTKRITGVISFYQNNGATAPVPLEGINGKSFSDLFRVYNPQANGWSTGATGSLDLGGFRVNVYLMDHAAIPTVAIFGLGGDPNQANLRVLGYQVWARQAANAKKTLILDTTDNRNFITKTIATDYLFMSWIPEFFTDSIFTEVVTNRRETSLAVAACVRFPYDGNIHYVLPLHIDDIMGSSYNPGHSTHLWDAWSIPSGYRAQGVLPTYANFITNVKTAWFTYQPQSHTADVYWLNPKASAAVRVYFSAWKRRAYE